MRVECIRPPADKQGPDIVDPLLRTEAAGVARGTAAIDYHSTNRMDERGNCILMPRIPTGSLVNVTEASGSYRGKMKGFSTIIDISADGRTFTATTAVTIEREMK